MFESLSYMTAHLRNLEALLQTYRQINLTIQSAFLILGTFLLSRVVETGDVNTGLFLELLLISLTVFSNIVMAQFQSVINARGEDVNWWLRRIILTEQMLPSEDRAFTRFKVHQSEDRLQLEEVERFLDPSNHATLGEIQRLLDADLDHVRKIINRSIIRGIRLMWIMVVGISAGSLFLKG